MMRQHHCIGNRLLTAEDKKSAFIAMGDHNWRPDQMSAADYPFCSALTVDIHYYTTNGKGGLHGKSSNIDARTILVRVI
eukprot:scaffold148224_cov36-Prasinocladus_malaysianus.AAC.5